MPPAARVLPPRARPRQSRAANAGDRGMCPDSGLELLRLREPQTLDAFLAAIGSTRVRFGGGGCATARTRWTRCRKRCCGCWAIARGRRRNGRRCSEHPAQPHRRRAAAAHVPAWLARPARSAGRAARPRLGRRLARPRVTTTGARRGRNFAAALRIAAAPAARGLHPARARGTGRRRHRARHAMQRRLGEDASVARREALRKQLEDWQ